MLFAVLVAISIPIFSGQLEKAREATDAANIRDMYAEISVGLLDESLNATTTSMTLSGGYTATYVADTGKFTVTVASVPIHQTDFTKWNSGNPVIAGYTLATCPAAATTSVVYTFTVSGNQTYLSSITFA